MHDPLGQAFITHQRSRLLQACGDHVAALRFNASALKAYRSVGDQQAVVEALNIRGGLRFLTGDLDGAAKDRTDALKLAKRLGDRYETRLALRGLGDVFSAMAQPDMAHAHYGQADVIGHELGLADTAS